MLKHWDTHAEHQHFISEAVALLNPSQLKKLYSMSDSWKKLTSMNLDPVGEFLAPFYSNTGRPAINQPQILRSFILMLDRKFTSLTNWVNVLQSDDLLAISLPLSPQLPIQKSQSTEIPFQFHTNLFRLFQVLIPSKSPIHLHARLPTTELSSSVSFSSSISSVCSVTAFL